MWSYSCIIFIYFFYNDFPYQKSMVLTFHHATVLTSMYSGSVWLSWQVAVLNVPQPLSYINHVQIPKSCAVQGMMNSRVHLFNTGLCIPTTFCRQEKILPIRASCSFVLQNCNLCSWLGKLQNISSSKKSFMFPKFSSVGRKTSHGSHLFCCFGQAE